MARSTGTRTATLRLVVALVAVSLSQRTAVASVGPVLTEIKHSLALSSTATSFLTAIPLLCFGIFAPLGWSVSRRIGPRRAVGLFSTALALGLLLRLGPDDLTLYAGTLVAAGSIGALNVVLPPLVRLEFPDRTGLMMGVYTTVLIAAAAAAAGLTVPLSRIHHGGWRAAFAVWMVLAACSATAWLALVRGGFNDSPGIVVSEPSRLLRDRTAWLITGFFAAQSASYYATLTWLPTLLTDHGLSSDRAGAVLSLSNFVQVPVALMTPWLATRRDDQRLLVAASCAFAAAGYASLLLSPHSLAYLAAVLLGIGQGSSFPLALAIMVMRSPTPRGTIALSSMVQTIGYLLAALGPLVTGLLRSGTGGWTVPLIFLLGVIVPQLFSGLGAGRHERQLRL